MEKQINVLFLGNSLMYFNDMPKLFASLAQAAGKPVTVGSVTKGAATMSDFAAEQTEVGRKLRTKLDQHWDYIIIEPSRRITPDEPTVLAAELEAAKRLQALAGSVGAEILLYSVWGNNTGSLKIFHAESPTAITAVGKRAISRADHAQFMREVGKRVSAELGGAPIIDAGRAFEYMIANMPGVNLYDPDERHPSAEGSYLAACAVYARLFGERTEGNTFTAELPAAPQLQKAADAVVLG